MAELWKQLPRETYLAWCEAILSESSEKLNEWELVFVQDIEERAKHGWFNITKRQADKLEAIYAEKTS